jgi:hypothetical protein
MRLVQRRNYPASGKREKYFCGVFHAASTTHVQGMSRAWLYVKMKLCARGRDAARGCMVSEVPCEPIYTQDAGTAKICTQAPEFYTNMRTDAGAWWWKDGLLFSQLLSEGSLEENALNGLAGCECDELLHLLTNDVDEGVSLRGVLMHAHIL